MENRLGGMDSPERIGAYNTLTLRKLHPMAILVREGVRSSNENSENKTSAAEAGVILRHLRHG